MTTRSQDREARTGIRPLVIINGLAAPGLVARAYGLYFRVHGFPLFVAPQSLLNHGDIRGAAEMLASHVHQVCQQTGSAKVHLVGMSLGGLIGLYYLKCGNGAGQVDRFVSVGGPLNGCALARISTLPPFGRIRALAQTRTSSELVQELQAAPLPERVRMYSLGTTGDVVTPRSSWQVEGIESIETTYGRFPIGHWSLFTHPGNLRAVLDLLQGA